MKLRIAVPAFAAFTTLLAAAPAAHAAGGPIVVPTINDSSGIVSPDGENRYVVLPHGRTDTLVARIEVGTGEVRAVEALNSRFGEGFGFAQVAEDKSSTGLSADGKTLVMIDDITGPINRGELAVFSTPRMHLKRKIELNGQFTLDAVSPDGSTAYVVQYPRNLDYSTYRVRELDLETGKLKPGVIADEDVGEEPEGPMRGLALTRVSSPDGRWAYTLYDGAGGVPFIHALDTEEGEAVCIFLDDLQGLGYSALHKLSMAGDDDVSSLTVSDRSGAPRILVDTADFSVAEPAAPAPPESGDVVPAALAAGIGAALLLALGAVLIARRRRAAGAPGPATPSAP